MTDKIEMLEDIKNGLHATRILMYDYTAEYGGMDFSGTTFEMAKTEGLVARELKGLKTKRYRVNYLATEHHPTHSQGYVQYGVSHVEEGDAQEALQDAINRHKSYNVNPVWLPYLEEVE